MISPFDIPGFLEKWTASPVLYKLFIQGFDFSPENYSVVKVDAFHMKALWPMQNLLAF